MSDDTQMTLFSAEALVESLRRGDEPEAWAQTAHHAYLDWLETQGRSAPDHLRVSRFADEPALNEGRAPGNTCLSALASGERGCEEVAEKLRRALAHAAARTDVDAAIRDLGEGWVAEEALAVGVYAAPVGESFVDTVAIAANHDGDSDSTASIAGQIYGCAHGTSSLPAAWVRRRDVLDPLLMTARELAARGASRGVPNAREMAELTP